MTPDASLGGKKLTSAISDAIAALYRDFYGHDRTTANTFINDDVVVCVLKDILTTTESRLVRFGESQEVIDGRVTFQTDTQTSFTAVIERHTGRRVTAFLCANQTTPRMRLRTVLPRPQPGARSLRHMTPQLAPGPPLITSDEELMRRVQADDIRAFEELYDCHSARALARSGSLG